MRHRKRRLRRVMGILANATSNRTTSQLQRRYVALQVLDFLARGDLRTVRVFRGAVQELAQAHDNANRRIAAMVSGSNRTTLPRTRWPQSRSSGSSVRTSEGRS